MIAETFIKRPVTAIVISLVIVIVGILAISSLAIGQYPEITPPTVQHNRYLYRCGCANG
jgi:HAE1 family hydrophobic/amphiphilic exporter-1